MDEAFDRAIDRIARRQGGFVKREQLIALGLSAEQIKYRIKIGRLIRVHRGVYAVGHLPRLPVDRAHGALLACGPTAVLSHRSAASLWGLYSDWKFPFEVTTPSTGGLAGLRCTGARRSRGTTSRPSAACARPAGNGQCLILRPG